jgi:copper chaperone CopZ
MKHFLIILLVTIITGCAISGNAQVKVIKVGVDGFTCSLCAKGVEGQFKALDFIKSVQTDLKNTTFTMKAKDSPQISYKSISDAITDGGFTLREILVEGEGKIINSGNGVISVSMTNSPNLELHGLKEQIADDAKVSFKGKMSSDLKSINISEVRVL